MDGTTSGPPRCFVLTQHLGQCTATGSTPMRVRVRGSLQSTPDQLSVRLVPDTTRLLWNRIAPNDLGTASVCLEVEVVLSLELACDPMPLQGIDGCAVRAAPGLSGRVRVTVPVTCEVAVPDAALEQAVVEACVTRLSWICTEGTPQTTSGSDVSVSMAGIVFGQMDSEQFGLSLANAGDRSGDLVADFAAGGPGGPPFAHDVPGLIRTLSGQDGQIFMTVTGLDPGAEFGFSVASLGDVDGDGVGDFLVGAPNASPGGIFRAGSALLISGQTGAVLQRFDGAAEQDLLGWSVAGLGDVNGDGVPDFAITTLNRAMGPVEYLGEVTVYSGMTYAPLYSILGTESGAGFGFSLTTVTDANGDGVADLLVGAPNAVVGGIPESGRAFLYSGQDGSLLQVFSGGPGEGLGWSTANLGDITGDGLPEMAIGAPSANPGGLTEAGSVLVFSANGLLRYRIDGHFTGGHAGASVAAADGLLIIGAPDMPEQDGTPTGLVSLYRLSNGTFLRDLPAPFSNGQFGWTVAGGNRSFAVGAPLASTESLTWAGAVVLYQIDADTPVLDCTLYLDLLVRLSRPVQVSLGAPPC